MSNLSQGAMDSSFAQKKASSWSDDINPINTSKLSEGRIATNYEMPYYGRVKDYLL